MSYKLSDETLDAIAAAGFDVYQNPDKRWQTYALFTDGTRIGYIQNDCGRLHLSTVHIPCRECGTGFSLRDDPFALTREGLERAFVTAPNWASGFDRAAVRKWPNLETYMRGQISKYEKVREGLAK
ncbi:MAG: hypothetical protein E6Q77_06565 [Rhizobium sp.]|nr:MAG: hypothetical protein E6Q77_06565 [Rhizobium sp.]